MWGRSDKGSRSSKGEDVLGGSGQKEHKEGEGSEKKGDRERDNARALQRSALRKEKVHAQNENLEK